MSSRIGNLVSVPRDLCLRVKPLIEMTGDNLAAYSRRVLLAVAQGRWTPTISPWLAAYLDLPSASVKERITIRLTETERADVDAALAALNAGTSEWTLSSGTTVRFADADRRILDEALAALGARRTDLTLSSALTAGLYLVWKEPWENLPF